MTLESELVQNIVTSEIEVKGRIIVCKIKIGDKTVKETHALEGTEKEVSSLMVLDFWGAKESIGIN